MLSSLEIARTVFYRSGALAVEGPDGVWGSTVLGPRAFYLHTMRIYRLDIPGAPVPRRTPARGVAAQYPEATQPRRTRP
jgi:hypothetical protein